MLAEKEKQSDAMSHQNGSAAEVRVQPFEAAPNGKADDAETGLGPLDDVDDIPLPPDGGWGWVVTIASFFINLIVDGVCYTYAIIKIELEGTFVGASQAQTALVGSLVPAVYLIVGPVVSILANKFGCRPVSIIGSVIAGVFFFISSFSTSIQMMMVTYGVMGGVGFGMMYLPSIVMVGHYFDRYRALATGIAVCGSGIGTFVFAPLATWLVDMYGWRGCNVIIAGIILNGAIFGSVFRPLARRTWRTLDVAGTSTIIEEIKAQKRRNRTVSGGSVHDGALITHENHLVLSQLKHDQLAEEDADQTAPADGDARGHHCNGKLGHSANHVNHNNTSSSRVSIKVDDAPEVTFYQTGKVDLPEATFHQNGVAPEAAFHANENGVSGAHDHHSSRTGSRFSMRSATRVESLNPFDRQDALFTGSVAKLPEYKVCVSHTEFVRSVLVIGEKPKTSIWKSFIEKALEIFDFTLFRSVTFIVLCASGFLVFLGLYTPFVYVQQKAIDLGTAKETASYIILVLGVANTVSRILAGVLADQKWVDCLVIHNVAAIVAGGATCFVPVLNEFSLLCAYAALFGVAIAAFIALRSIVFVEMLGLKKLNNAFGLTSLFQGVAVLVGSPLSGELKERTGSYTVSFLVCGALIVLGGVICLPIRRIAHWENSRETNFHEAKGFGSHYTKVDDEKNNSQNETQKS